MVIIFIVMDDFQSMYYDKGNRVLRNTRTEDRTQIRENAGGAIYAWLLLHQIHCLGRDGEGIVSREGFGYGVLESAPVAGAELFLVNNLYCGAKIRYEFTDRYTKAFSGSLKACEQTNNMIHLLALKGEFACKGFR